ncbi:hypothetical protein ACFL67_03070 [candidate division KSB1 bacterium]
MRILCILIVASSFCVGGANTQTIFDMSSYTTTVTIDTSNGTMSFGLGDSLLNTSPLHDHVAYDYVSGDICMAYIKNNRFYFALSEDSSATWEKIDLTNMIYRNHLSKISGTVLPFSITSYGVYFTSDSPVVWCTVTEYSGEVPVNAYTCYIRPPDNNWDMFSQRDFTISTTPIAIGQNYWWSGMILTDPDDFNHLLAYSYHPGGEEYGGNEALKAVHSYDSGDTWSDPMFIVQADPDSYFQRIESYVQDIIISEYEGMRLLPEGLLISGFVAQVDTTSGAPKNTRGILMSTDFGLTWEINILSYENPFMSGGQYILSEPVYSGDYFYDREGNLNILTAQQDTTDWAYLDGKDIYKSSIWQFEQYHGSWTGTKIKNDLIMENTTWDLSIGAPGSQNEGYLFLTFLYKEDISTGIHKKTDLSGNLLTRISTDYGDTWSLNLKITDLQCNTLSSSYYFDNYMFGGFQNTQYAFDNEDFERVLIYEFSISSLFNT